MTTFVQPAAPKPPERIAAPGERILLVGSPNVGKSAIFNRLTGRYAVVSNYPGTTVELTSGRCDPLHAEIVDTPGMYSLSPITQEERVARDALLDSHPAAVLHVIDARNISRLLALTLELLQAGLPTVLALNLFDECRAAGVRIDVRRLEELLGTSVVATVATTGEGLDALLKRLHKPPRPPTGQIVYYGPVLEAGIREIADILGSGDGLPARFLAVRLLESDASLAARTRRRLGDDAMDRIHAVAAETRKKLAHDPAQAIAMAVRERVEEIVRQAVHFPADRPRTLLDRLSDLCMNPLTGLPILAAVVYFGLYQFVGIFGAGTLVNFIDTTVFDRWFNPAVKNLCDTHIPWPWLGDLFAGEYGVLTMGLRYAVAIVLPIVGTFFLAFSLLEDSGYLPRLAMLIDRVFKRVGLSGRAVVPMALGFGCVTMATLVTRTLESRRERIIATILLALAIPCSAQVGVIVGLLGSHPAALLVWAGIVGGVFLSAGTLAARFLPGEAPSFYMELPRLRRPRLLNVLKKTFMRMLWYFKEVLPLFVLASVLIWLAQLTGAFEVILGVLRPIVRAMGLPDASATALLFGFFRRDYGAAGLYDLHHNGLLSGNQLAVASVTLTLFLPCMAQLLIMNKERGTKLTLLVAAAVTLVALAAGMTLHLVLTGLGVQL